MQNCDYDLCSVRRYLEFPLKVAQAAIRPRNAFVLNKTHITAFFISFIFGYENKTYISDGNRVHANPTTPYLEIARPGDMIDMIVPAVRDELFFRYDTNSRTAELFGLESCEFVMTPRFRAVQEEIYAAIDSLRRPGMADRIDLLALELAREAMLNRRDDERGKRGVDEPDERIFKVSSYLEIHYDQPLNLDELIRESGLERRTFYREWNKFYTESPKSRLLRLRFDKACEMLRSSRRRIYEIAEECGFSDAMYFSRMFRGRFEVSPGEYRARNHFPAERGRNG